MAVSKFINLLAISSLAILASTFDAVPAVNALTVHPAHGARAAGNPHHRIAKRVIDEPVRKRDSSKRCKPRSTSVAASTHIAATSAVPSATTKVAATTIVTSAKVQKTAKASSTHDNKDVATSASSSAKAVATTKAASSGGSNPSFPGCNGKRGLAWSNHEADLIPQFASDQVCFIYDWEESLQYGMTVPDGMVFIPLLWGTKNEAAFASKVKAGYSTHAAGMNEPDIGSQSNLSPQDGANLWNKYFCGLKSQGYTLISPAPATGPKWLTQFKAAGACDWDITAGHIYTTSVDDFKTVAGSYHDAFNKPVAITEWACQSYSGGSQCDSSQIQSFMSGVMSFMDNDPRFVGYSMFAPMTSSELESNNLNGLNALINNAGTGLTSLGSFYVYANL